MFGVRKALRRAASEAGDAMAAAARAPVDRAHETASELKDRIERELPHWVQRASDGLRTVLLIFSATTALAAGFIAGIGIEFIALVDKWSIVGMVIFYAGVMLALLSPFLIIPHTFRAWARRQRWELVQRHLADIHRNKKALAEKQSELATAQGKAEQHAEGIAKQDETIREKNSLIEGIQRQIKALDGSRQKDDRQWLSKLFRANPNREIDGRRRELEKRRASIAAEIARLRLARTGLSDDRQRIEAEIAGINDRIDKIAASKADIDQKIELPKMVKRLLACAFASYVAVALITLLNLFDGWWAFGTIVISTVLCGAIFYFRDFGLIGPSLTAYFVVVGYGIGLNTFGYETNVNMEINRESHHVRILLATSNGFIVVKGACVGRAGVARFAAPSPACGDSTKRELAFLPKEAVGIVSVQRHDGFVARLATLKPFVWIRPYAMAWSTLVPDAHGRSTKGAGP